jgi:hypothetical protein
MSYLRTGGMKRVWDRMRSLFVPGVVEPTGARQTAVMASGV